MKDKIYYAGEYLALGLLVGYLGLYALDLVKNFNQAKQTPTNSKEVQRNYV